MSALLHEMSIARHLVLPSLLLSGLAAISFWNYLLFHVLAEFFAIVVALLMSVVIWHTHRFSRNYFLMYLGCGYFWVGILDLFHTLVYKGMAIYPDADLSWSTQFWILTRGYQALLLLSAPWFLNHSLRPTPWFLGFGALTAGMYYAVMQGWMPTTFIEGQGLTPFKVYSEYLIISVLGLSAVYLYRRRQLLDSRVLTLMLGSIALTAGGELAFTFYVDLYGLSNILGHFFKLLSFWLIFFAIVHTTLHEPFAMLARGSHTYAAIPEPIIVVNLRGQVQQANHSACELIGKSMSQILGQPCHGLFHPPGITPKECPVCRHIEESRELSGVELEFSDSGVWREFSLSPLHEGKALVGMVQVSNDITARKRAQTALQTNESRYRSLFEDSPVPMWEEDLSLVQQRLRILHREGVRDFRGYFEAAPDTIEELLHLVRIIRYNHSALRLYQCAQAKDFTNLWRHSWTPEYRAGFQAQLLAFLDAQPRFEVEVSLLVGAGERRWVVRRLEIPEHARSTWHQVLVSMLDISERRRMEEALRHSEQRLSAALDGAALGFWEFNPQTGEAMFSPRWYTMLGYAPYEMPSHYTTWRALLHPDEREGIENQINDALKTGQSFSIQVRMFSKSGDWRHIQGQGRIVAYDAQGYPKRVIGTHLDITEAKQAENLLRRQVEELAQTRKATLNMLSDLERARSQAETAREEAEQANLAKSQFLANMSHEIRTPMNAILGYAQILQRRGDLSGEIRHGVEVIERSGTHLLGLINDILDLSKIEAGRMELHVTDFDLCALLNDLAAMFQVRCGQAELGWQLSIPTADSLLVQGDEGKLRQVLINLLGNAVKFTEHGQVSLRVEIASDDPETYCFSVCDTGPGIALQALEKIFEPFQQGSSGLHKGGTGLGLAITRKQLELMKVPLTVQSRLGLGSEFSFKLRLPTAHTVISKDERYTRVQRLSPNQTVRAFVVDDIALNRELLGSILRDIGVTVQEVSSGEQALQLMQEERPDIVFMDYRMPGLNGVETTQRIRNEQGKAPKIVMCSASAFIHQRQAYLDAGCDASVSKPFRAEEVFAQLAELLGISFDYQADTPSTPSLQPQDFGAALAKLPAASRHALQECVEFGMLTELKETLDDLACLGPELAAFSAHCRHLLSHHQTDEILTLLDTTQV